MALAIDIRGSLLEARTRRSGAIAALVCVLLITPATAAENPFPSLVGSWSGTGEATLDSGKTESMRCKGYYTGQGADNLTVAIRCANASSKIDLRATLNYANGNVSGNWEERTYNTAGSVEGKATATKVNLAITGGGLNASMAVSISGSSHSVAISTQGTGLKSVKIQLSKG